MIEYAMTERAMMHLMGGPRRGSEAARGRTKTLKWVRFALSGSLLGIAMAGLLGARLGWDKEATDATGAVIGATLSAVLVKAIHIV